MSSINDANIVVHNKPLYGVMELSII